MIPQLSEALRFLFHVLWSARFSPLFDAGGCHGLQLELQATLKLRGPLGVLVVSACFSMFQQQTCAMDVFSMLLIQWLVRTSTFWDGLVQPAGETKINQALQVFRNIDPPIEGQEVGTSEFGNGDICGNWWDRKTTKTRPNQGHIQWHGFPSR